MNVARNITAVSIAAAAGAVLGLVQVTVAELMDITTLSPGNGHLGVFPDVQTEVARLLSRVVLTFPASRPIPG
jgi:hypothetical protein